MPWLETSPVEQRERFIRDHRAGLYMMTELCARYDVSRKTGYKWLERFDEAGRRGLQDRSRAPHRIATEVAAVICAARRQHPSWGPAKLVAWLRPRYPGVAWPAVSTAGDLLARRGAGQEAAAPAALPASRRRPAHHDAAQRSLDGGLQRALPHARRDLLLSADDHRPAHSLSPRVPRPALNERPRGAPGLRPTVSRIWPAGRDSYGQRGTLRHVRHSRAVAAQRLVAALGHSAPADPPGLAAAERRARAHAQDPQGRGHSSTPVDAGHPATGLHRLPPPVQRRAPPRGAARPDARVALPPVTAGVLWYLAAGRVSRTLHREARHQCGYHPPPEALALPGQRAEAAPRRSRGDRRRRLVHSLLPRALGSRRRTRLHHQDVNVLPMSPVYGVTYHPGCSYGLSSNRFDHKGS